MSCINVRNSMLQNKKNTTNRQSLKYLFISKKKCHSKCPCVLIPLFKPYADPIS